MGSARRAADDSEGPRVRRTGAERLERPLKFGSEADGRIRTASAKEPGALVREAASRADLRPIGFARIRDKTRWVTRGGMKTRQPRSSRDSPSSAEPRRLHVRSHAKRGAVSGPAGTKVRMQFGQHAGRPATSGAQQWQAIAAIDLDALGGSVLGAPGCHQEDVGVLGQGA
jgi:hypothetical protein